MAVFRRDTSAWRRGQFLRVDDRTGFYEWASDTQKEWTGQIVAKRVWEARHPQDFVRGRIDDMRVYEPRPDATITGIPGSGPVVTTIAAGSGGDMDRVAPMGALGEFAIGQTDEGDYSPANTPGANTISVVSVAGMTPGDQIGVMLDSNDTFLTQIKMIEGPTILLLTGRLPSNASVGNTVTDYSANVVGPLTSQTS